MALKNLVALILSLLVFSCGKAEEDDAEKDKSQATETNAETSLESAENLKDDDDTLAEVITAQIDEAISLAADDAQGSEGASLAQEDDSNEGITIGIKRGCEASEDGKGAVVTIERNFAGGPITGSILSWDWSFTWKRQTKLVRTWTKSDSTIECLNTSFAKVPILNMEGVNLAVEFSGTRERKTLRSNETKGIKDQERSFSFTIKEGEGSRSFNIDSITQESDHYIIAKTVTSDVTRNHTVKRFNGTSQEYSINVKSLENTPLKIEVKRDSDLNWVSRTIRSGTFQSDLKDGGYVQAVFEDVVYNKRGIFKVCRAESGKVSGTVFDKDGNEVSTFVVNFDSNGKEIIVNENIKIEYNPEGCSLS